MIRGATILQSGPLSYTEHGQVSRPLSPPLRLDNLEHFHFLSFRDNAYPRVTRQWWHSRYHGARFSLPSTPKIDHDGISHAAPEAPAAPSEAIASGASRPVFFSILVANLRPLPKSYYTDVSKKPPMILVIRKLYTRESALEWARETWIMKINGSIRNFRNTVRLYI